jgi:DNA processing protein
MGKKAYWVGFNHVKGIGAVRLRALLDYFGDLEIAWQAPADALMQVGLSTKIVENILRMRSSLDLTVLMESLEQKHIRILIADDPEYPPLLREIDQPPPVLYLRGEISDADRRAVAIVGTRKVTAYGRQVTEDLALYLARQGVTIVSGLARGIDGIAHQAALKTGGRTIAVLGSGVDQIYPPEHAALAEQISTRGAVCSDYAPGTMPDGINFPPRNRIISGLSLATVVVEAGEGSGALITATFAVDQGREVFAVPGNIFAPQSKGTNRLIQQGAHVLTSPRDILDVLNMDRVEQVYAARSVLPADEVEQKLLSVMGYDPIHVDEIGAQTGFPIARVSAALTLMELKGMVRQVGGMNYVAVKEDEAEYNAGVI